MRSKDKVVFAGCQSSALDIRGISIRQAAGLLKSLIKGLCVAIEYTHQMVALLVRRRILRIAFFKKKFRITPAILRGLHRLESEACGLENDGIILAVYEFCS